MQSDLIEKAQEYHLAGDFDKAQDFYLQALEHLPDNPDLNYALGLVALQTEQYESAKEFLLKAISFNNSNAVYYKDAAIAFHGIGALDQAIQYNSKSLELAPDNQDALFNMGMLYKEQSKLEQAIDIFQEVIQQDNTNSALLSELADTYRLVNNYTEAENTANRAIEYDPHNISALYTLAHSLYCQNRSQEAIPIYEQLLQHDEDNYNYNCEMAKALLDRGFNRRAQRFAERSVELLPEQLDAYSVLVEALIRNSELEKALKTNNHVLKYYPENLHHLSLKANILELLGRYKEAFELVKPHVLNQQKLNALFLPMFIRHADAFGFQKYAESLIKAIIKKNALTSRALPVILFEAGHFYHRLKRYDEAFEFYKYANISKQHTYNRVFTECFFTDLKNTFNSKTVKGDRGSTSKMPIFIVGMPRSGTSLVEKILASHSQVSGAGELSKIQELISSLPVEEVNPKAMQPEERINLSNNKIYALADEYLEFSKNIVNSSGRYITDKMPQNFLYLGFIALLFPKAIIIHCNRNPMDTCFSCYAQNFASNGADFSYDCDDLGHYYNLYSNLMKYWKKTLPIQIYDIQYESLIENPKREIKNLLEICDLDWEDACLEHQKSDHITMTASYNQVRKPIYTSSKNKWKKYKSHLKPLIKALKKYNA